MKRRLPLSDWFPVIVLLLITAGYGARHLNADGFWYDEWWSLVNAGASYFSEPLNPVQIWARVAADDPWQTPGYLWALSAWGNSAGWSEFAARALSLFGALLAVALMYRFARAISGNRVAAIGAAALLGGSAWFLYYTHEVRAYMLLVTCTVAFVYAYWRIAVQPRRSILSYALVALTGMLLIYTHPNGLLTYGMVGVWHFFRLRHTAGRRSWIKASIALAVPAVAFLPWLAVLLDAAARVRQIARVSPTPALLAEIFARMIVSFSTSGVALLGLLAVFSVKARAARFAWGLFALLLPITALSYLVLRVSEPRYGIVLLPMFALIGGLGVAELDKRRIPYPLVLGLWVIPALLMGGNTQMGMVIQNADTYPPPVRESADILRPYLTGDAAVISYLGENVVPDISATPLVFYFGADRVSIVDMRTSQTLDTFIQRFDHAIGAYDRAWLMTYPLWEQPESALIQYLFEQRGFHLCTRLDTPDTLDIAAYARANDDQPGLQFGDSITVRPIGGIDTLPDRALVWLDVTSTAPADSFSAGVYLLDASGATVRQSDHGIQTGGSCWWGELALDGLPDGEYSVMMSVYNWQTLERLPGIGFDGTAGEVLPLGSLHIGADETGET